MITTAREDNYEIVKEITHKTIENIYPHYYARGAVDFFLQHHNEQNIMRDIHNGCVYLLVKEETPVGTVTIVGNEINRLFVLPAYQGCGYGRELLDFAERKVAEDYDEIVLDVSLPAKAIYLKRGFKEVGYNRIPTGNGDYLCFDVMKKNAVKTKTIHYDNRIFMPLINSENGEVDGETRFYYHQKGSLIWAEYEGGDVEKGFLIGSCNERGELEFTYQHLNNRKEIRMGKCRSTPSYRPDGKLEMHEEWQWLNGDQSCGKSVLVEM